MSNQLPNRKSTRLKGYDYSRKGRYFITIVAKDRLKLFGDIKNGEMHLNILGEIAKNEWINTLNIRNNISLGEYMIMPEHIHFVFHIDEQLKQPKETEEQREQRSGAVKGRHIIKNHSVSTVIRGYKAAVTSQFRKTIKAEQERDRYALHSRLPKCASKVDLSKTIWVSRYHDIIIRDDNAYRNISQYVKDNPEKAQRALDALST